MFNGLKPETQALAEPFLRSEKTFVNGIEKGNRNLLTNLRKKYKIEIPLQNIQDSSRAKFSYVGTIHVPKNPKTLDGVLNKRHELFEGKNLFKNQNPSYFTKIKKMQKDQEDLLRYDASLNMDWNIFSKKFESLRKRNNNLSTEITNKQSPYFSHYSSNVLKDEHKLVANTPRSHKTNLFKFRKHSGEAADLKKRFGINYGIN